MTYYILRIRCLVSNVHALLMVSYYGILLSLVELTIIRNAAVVLWTSSASKEHGVKLLCARYHERQRSVVAITAAAAAVDVIIVVCAWRFQRRLQGRQPI